jgi:hypothetical protein
MLDAIRRAIAAPLVVVRLTAPLTVIEERLGSAPTSGRADDLARAREQYAVVSELGLDESVVENVGPLKDTAMRVLDVAGWSW